MELALALRYKTVADLERVMTEREFRLWQRHVLPARRIELYLANIARVVANSVGSKLTLNDFLFDFGNKPPPKMTAKGFAGMAGAGFRKLGQGRKKT